MEPKLEIKALDIDLFSNLLGGLFDKINDTIDEAAKAFKNADMELEIKAGEEISRAIEQVKNAYKAELNETIDKVSVAAKTAFDSLNSMVQRFEKATHEELQSLMVQAQHLANTLPFSSKQPQLRSIKPRYIVIDDLAQSSLVMFKGNFPWSAKPGFEPSLTFAGQSCFLADLSTQSFTFQISHSAFKDADKAQFSYKTGNLQVPWDDGLIFSHKTEFDYRVGLGALPQLAGKGYVEYIYRGTERLSTEVTTGTYRYSGSIWYPKHWHEEDLEVTPAPDWTINTSIQPQIVNFSRQRGRDSRVTITSVSPTRIVVHIRLYCGSGRKWDIFTFNVQYTQYKDQPVERSRTENFEMNWHDSRLLEPRAQEVISKVVFDDYHGVHQEYAAPDLNSGVLKIEAAGNGKWKIWAEPPKDLGLTSTEISKELKEKLETVHRLQHLLKVANLPKELRPPVEAKKTISVDLRSAKEEETTTTTTTTPSTNPNLEEAEDLTNLAITQTTTSTDNNKEN